MDPFPEHSTTVTKHVITLQQGPQNTDIYFLCNSQLQHMEHRVG